MSKADATPSETAEATPQATASTPTVSEEVSAPIPETKPEPENAPAVGVESQTALTVLVTAPPPASREVMPDEQTGCGLWLPLALFLLGILLAAGICLLQRRYLSLRRSTTKQQEIHIANEELEPLNDSAPISHDLQEVLGHLTSQMELLQKSFEEKLKYDESKQTVIDRQYNELERYRHEESTKLSRAIIMDVIGEIDDVEKSNKYYDKLEPTAENFSKLLKLFREFSADLCDLLERHDITSYCCEPGEFFNPKRQRVLKTVLTDRPELDKTVMETARRGFESDSRIIRHELVNVYVFKQTEAIS